MSQIDVAPEISSKLLKQTDNYLKDKGKDPHNPTMFDDAQYTVFKEMLPYWSSFTKRYKEYHDKNPRLPCKSLIIILRFVFTLTPMCIYAMYVGPKWSQKCLDLHSLLTTQLHLFF